MASLIFIILILYYKCNVNEAVCRSGIYKNMESWVLDMV